MLDPIKNNADNDSDGESDNVIREDLSDVAQLSEESDDGSAQDHRNKRAQHFWRIAGEPCHEVHD